MALFLDRHGQIPQCHVAGHAVPRLLFPCAGPDHHCCSHACGGNAVQVEAKSIAQGTDSTQAVHDQHGGKLIQAPVQMWWKLGCQSECVGHNDRFT